MKEIEKSEENLRKENDFLKHELKKLQSIEKNIKAAYNLLEAREEKYRTMSDCSYESIFIGTDNFQIIDCNESACNMFGYAKMEMIGLRANFLLSSAYDNMFNSDLLDNSFNQSEGYEAEGLRKDGSCFPIEVHFKITSCFKNQNLKWVLYIRDNVHYKNAEKKFIDSEKQLKAINYTKDKFISIISHDLKSPLNALLGMGEILLNHYEKIDENEFKVFIQNIYISTQQAAKLVDNLLEWSRIQMGSLKAEPSQIDLSEIINSSIQLLKFNAIGKEINIVKDYPKPLYVYADDNMIRTVIRNLLSNAIKFTNAKGEVSIRVQEVNCSLEVSVCDNGTGISKDQLDKLFQNEINYSTPGTKREKGTGLGLVLSKEFVKLNGGTIYAQSEPGKGSTFTFTLPKAEKIPSS